MSFCNLSIVIVQLHTKLINEKRQMKWNWNEKRAGNSTEKLLQQKKVESDCHSWKKLNNKWLESHLDDRLYFFVNPNNFGTYNKLKKVLDLSKWTKIDKKTKIRNMCMSVGNSAIKVLQIVCINLKHILVVSQHARCNYKLWKVF